MFKRFVLLALTAASLLVTTPAFSAANDMFIEQGMPDGSGPYMYKIPCPGVTHCLLAYDKGAYQWQIQWVTFGSPFIFTAGSPSTLTFDLTWLTSNASVIRGNIGAETAGAASSAQAAAVQRANHTGTQSVSTITGLATVATTGSYNDLSNKPAARSFNYTTRSLNTCFQLSTTRDVQVTYNAEVTASLALVGGQRGTLYLETFSDSGCTSGTQELMRSTNGNTSALIVAVGNVSVTTLNVNGIVPAGAYVKLRTANDTGSPSFTARPGQEVSL